MRAGLVKSLVLDRRKEIGALPAGVQSRAGRRQPISLSEGQRVMLRAASLKKLRKLEADFARDRSEPPPQDAGGVRGHGCFALSRAVSAKTGGFETADERDEIFLVLRQKAELGENRRAPMRERLFSVDSHHAACDREQYDAARGL